MVHIFFDRGGIFPIGEEDKLGRISHRPHIVTQGVVIQAPGVRVLNGGVDKGEDDGVSEVRSLRELLDGERAVSGLEGNAG